MQRFLLAAAALTLAGGALAQETVKIADVIELSGAGATVGTNWKNGVDLAVKEINDRGGILGRKLAVAHYDSQTNPGIAKAMATKAVDENPYVILGPIFSGSVMVNMQVAEQAEIPQITGAEAASVTQQGNPYIFRTSFSQALGMPKLANYLQNEVKAKSVAVVWINNDFGKGGRDAMVKELGARNIKVAADISTEQQQVDFSSAVLRAKSSGADALFAYLNEEESARLLRELRKQGYDKPIIGETTLMSQKVIDLAGDAVNGVRGHVGLTIDAPVPAIRDFAQRFERAYNSKSDHNGLKGYFAVYLVKAVTEKTGKFDRKAFAAALKNASFSAKDHPGLLMDVSFDAHGDLDRESFLVEVKDGKQVVIGTLPPVGRK